MSSSDASCLAAFRAKFGAVVDDETFVLIERARSICSLILTAPDPHTDGIVALEGVVSMLDDAMEAYRDRYARANQGSAS